MLTFFVISAGDIQRYCDAIARAFEPERIILFGSHAYGEPHRDSDVDVLVVMPRAKRHGRRPSQAIRRSVSAGVSGGHPRERAARNSQASARGRLFPARNHRKRPRDV